LTIFIFGMAARASGSGPMAAAEVTAREVTKDLRFMAEAPGATPLRYSI
jgi:hypothetical protein